MSGLEIVGAIINLLDLTAVTYKIIKGYKGLPGEFKAVGERLPVAVKTLDVIQTQAETAQIDDETAAAIQPLLEGCQTKVEELQAVFDKARKWKGNSVQAKYNQFLGAVGGKGKQVEALMEAILKDVQLVAAKRAFETATASQMDGLKRAIDDMAALQPDRSEGSGGSQNIHGNMTGGKIFYQQGLGTIQTADGDWVGGDKVGGNKFVVHYHGDQFDPDPVPDCMRSLGFPEMNARALDVDDAAEGTCDWLLKHEAYRGWTDSHRGLLWIKGKPGSGKSTLLKYALGNGAVPSAGSSALVLSFFFHARGTELQKKSLGLFRSLLHQLLKQVPDALPGLVGTFQQRCKESGEIGGGWQWHPKELQQFFERSLPEVLRDRPVWLLVDALDECGEGNAAELAAWFQSLLHRSPSSGPHFRVCFSCRHYPIVTLNDGAFEVCLERQNRAAISTYVLRELRAFSERTHSTIPDLITARAEGVFMWARLVVAQVLKLERDGESLGAIKRAIHSTPQTLGELYATVVQGMEPRSLKLLQWILFSTRPMTADELRWAMAIDPDGAHKSLDQCQRSDDFTSGDKIGSVVRSLSRGLAEIVPSSDAQIVQFIHQSVKDFFLDKGWPGLSGSTMPTNTEIGVAQNRLSKTCLRYLEMEEIANLADDEIRKFRKLSKDSDSDSDSDELVESSEPESFPFLHYATTSWVPHLSDIEGPCQEEFVQNLPTEAFLHHWAHIHATLNKKISLEFAAAGRASPVHVLSIYGKAATLKAIFEGPNLVWPNTDPNLGGRIHRAPRWWVEIKDGARRGGMLRIKTKRGDRRVPLSWVAVSDDLGWTPLLRAAEKGHEAVVRLLLATGKVDIESKDKKYGLTPLSWAARNGHEATVRLLLATGKVDIESKDKEYGQTPLSWAAIGGHEAVVRLLLATGKVDIESKDKEYGLTPLLWAARIGHEAVVRHLLAGGANAYSEDHDGHTPPWWAVQRERRRVAKLFEVLAISSINGVGVGP